MRGMGYFNHPDSPLDSEARSPDAAQDDSSFFASSTVLALGMATAVVGAVTLGLLFGRELRLRYKFRQRTPSDFFSKAGDSMSSPEYGMGI